MKHIVLLASACLMAGSAFAQWSTDLSKNLVISDPDLPAAGTFPQIAQTPDGNFWITWGQWENGNNFYIKAQLMTPAGEALLDEGGIYVSQHTTATYTTSVCGYGMDVAPNGDLVILVGDTRKDPDRHGFCPVAYRIDQEGNQLWGLDGVELPQSGSLTGDYGVAVSPAGTIMVGYSDAVGNAASGSMNFVIMRINEDGTLAWNETIATAVGRGSILACGEDDFYVSGLASGVKVYCYDALGDVVWGPTNVTSGDVNGYQTYPGFPDGQGGIFVPYYYAVSLSIFNNGLQHVSSDGEALMGLNGYDLVTNNGKNGYPAISCNAKRGEVLAFWEREFDSGNICYLYAQKLDYYGTPLWDEPKQLLQNDHWGPNVANGTILDNGNMILLYWVPGDGSSIKGYLNVLCLDSEGKQVWKSQLGRRAYCGQPKACFNDECAWIVWADNAEGSTSNAYGLVYGQRLYLQDGTAVAPESGVEAVGASDEAALAIQGNVLTINAASDATANVYDVPGRCVASYQVAAGPQSVELALPAGLYVVALEGSDIAATLKIQL